MVTKDPEWDFLKGNDGKERFGFYGGRFSVPALNKWPCVYLLDGAGVTGCSGSLYSFTAGNTKLGVFYVNFLGTFDQLYFHLGAMQGDTAVIPLSGTRDPT